MPKHKNVQELKESLGDSEEKLDAVIRKIGDSVSALKTEAGLNERAIIVLLQDHCGVPKKTLKKVLDSLTELHDYYCHKVDNS